VWGIIGLWWPWTGTGGGGVFRCRTIALLVVKLVVIPLQLSYRAACNNTQHCLKLPTYYCTSVTTMLIDISAHQVNIFAVTDGILASCRGRYQFLYCIRLLCGHDDEVWGRTEGFVISSPRFLTSLTWSWKQTDVYWPSQYGAELAGLSDEDYLTLVRLDILMGHGVAQLEDEMRCGFDSCWRHWNFTRL
jgi:hypothetical protein